MKKIAIYGYGVYGKRTSESFLLYWGGLYTVTAIFDRDPAGKEDRFWNLKILSPDKIREEYGNGTFEAIMVCIYKSEARHSVIRMIEDLGIPVFVPGDRADFADPDSFPQETDQDISICRDGYRLRILKNIFGAAGDCEKTQLLFLFDENGRLYIENYKKYLFDSEEFLISYPFRLRDPIPEKVYMKGNWCVLVKSYMTNYWHFTFETACCAYLMEAAGYKGNYIFKDLPFARELLLIMGISPDRLFDSRNFETHKVYVFERLFDINFSKTVKGNELYSADVLAEMASFIKQKLKKNAQSPEKIFIRRAGRRRLLNGEETAVRNGFTVITPEDHSVREQMELFYNADIVICPHGANSANCLYMHKGAVFAEIFSDCWIWGMNMEICGANGVHYLKFEGKAVPGILSDIDADYTVDESEYQRLIDKAEKIKAAEKAVEAS